MRTWSYIRHNIHTKTSCTTEPWAQYSLPSTHIQHWTWISIQISVRYSPMTLYHCWCFVIKFPFIVAITSLEFFFFCERETTYSRLPYSSDIHYKVEDSLCTLEILCHWVEVIRRTWKWTTLIVCSYTRNKSACLMDVLVNCICAWLDIYWDKIMEMFTLTILI